jgi:AcrR family transcriptional regulator
MSLLEHNTFNAPFIIKGFKMNRGERIATRTKSAIKKSLLELIKEKNYPDITVQEITERANVGRSTLYRHYQSKADVLIDFHKDMFEHLLKGLSTAESWVSQTPPDELVLFLEKHRKLGTNPFSLSYKLGNDLDYLMNNINKQFVDIVGEKLHCAYKEEESSIPLPILSVSISTLFIGLFMSWFTKFQFIDAMQFATYICRNVSAVVSEAVNK